MDQNFLPPIFCCIFCDVFCSGRLKDGDGQEMLFLFRYARNVKVVRQVFPLFSVSDDDEQLMETQSKMSKEILLAVFCFWSIFAKVYFYFQLFFVWLRRGKFHLFLLLLLFISAVNISQTGFLFLARILSSRFVGTMRKLLWIWWDGRKWRFTWSSRWVQG